MPITGSSEAVNIEMSATEGYQLDVLMGARRKIATIELASESDSDIRFIYDADWVRSGFALSPFLPLTGEISVRAVRNFLQNLLPEGHGLDELLSSTTIARNNTFGLIRLMGEETAGALSFRVRLQSARPTSFRRVNDQELANKLLANRTAGIPLTYWDGKTRLSVAGVQEKLNFLEVEGQLGFGEGLLCSNKIFKFETGRVPFIAVNELFTMQLAKHAGVAIPAVELRRYGDVRAFVIERFDRKLSVFNANQEVSDLLNDLSEPQIDYSNIERMKVSRRHVIDGCQATNLPPAFKYERQFGDDGDGVYLRDGVSFKKLLAVKTANTSGYQTQIIRWMTFNILVRNYDAHGKNISFFVSDKGLELAPFYDLVNVEASIQAIQTLREASTEQPEVLMSQPEYSRHFAMSIGDYDSGSAGNFDAPITAFMLASFADEFDISLARMQIVMSKMLESVALAITQSRVDALANDLSEEEIAHVDLCIGIVLNTIKSLGQEVAQITDMQSLL